MQRALASSKAMDNLKKLFRPEFINRIDQITVFHALGRPELYKIVDLLLTQVRNRLHEQKIELAVTDEIKDFLLQEGFDEEYGARPLRRAIQTHIDDTLADAVLAGQLASGQMARLVMRDGKVVVEREEASESL
jgi:ATP-dependent Clp protease ATP-binding subunit ClpC